MGKKKRQKTKELSVAIAEASSKGGDTGQQETQQPQAPRKRGRPRKVVVKTESEGKKVEPIEEPAASTATQGRESLTKKEDQHGRQQEELSSASARTRITKEEGVFEEIQLSKEEPSRSRARRKSKPRKST